MSLTVSTCIALVLFSLEYLPNLLDFHTFVYSSLTCLGKATKMRKIQRPWKATRKVQTQARASNSSTSTISTPKIHVNPIITTRDTRTFNQLLTFLASVCFFLFLCCHRTMAAMMKNPMLTSRMISTGKMKAQMKCVPGFRKHLKMYVVQIQCGFFSPFSLLFSQPARILYLGIHSISCMSYVAPPWDIQDFRTYPFIIIFQPSFLTFPYLK